jgi:hypothetical protein
MACVRGFSASLLVLAAIAAGCGGRRSTHSGQCSPGEKGCACAAGLTCSNGGLECRNGYCIDRLNCSVGTIDCPCGTGDSCSPSLTCSAGVCRSCTNDVTGCPCVSGTCRSLVCDAASVTCRSAKTCSNAGCVAHQQCAPGTATQDATCLISCEPGYLWNVANGTCVPDPAATCLAGLGSIQQACASRLRLCVQDAAGVHCGDCLNGAIEEDGACRAVRACDALGCAAAHRSCTPPGTHADAECGDCEPGFVISENQCVADPTKNCTGIQAACDAKNMLCVEGVSGAMCQGCKGGHILDLAKATCRLPHTCANLPTPCSGGQMCREGMATTDATCYVPCPPCNGEGEDGSWPELTSSGKCICKTKPGYFYSLSGTTGTFPCDADGDGWTREAARFSIDSVDPVIRANARCSLRKVNAFVLENEQGQVLPVPIEPPIPLYETVRNDDQEVLDGEAGSNALPLYGGADGRALRAAELNSLTKACAGPMADFNDNGLSDISEHENAQPIVPSDLVSHFQKYERFSYFIELHSGSHERTTDGLGAYRIKEKKRGISPDNNFAFRYGVEESGIRTSDYWQSCPRSRDAWYNKGAPTVTMDFASLSGPDNLWKGMMHHSQFKCIKIVDDIAYQEADRVAGRHLQTASTLGDPPSSLQDGMQQQDYLHATPNVCAAQPASKGMASSNPVDPVIRCTAKDRSSVQVGQVLWAAVRLVDSSHYSRGCILQCNGYPYLCPGSDPDSPTIQPCYHMCADIAASERLQLGSAESGYRLRGEVPMLPMADSVLGDSAVNTYQIRPPPAR